MYCQKCRTPLKLDASLEDTSTAALKLLIEATSRSLAAAPDHLESSRPLYTSEQKKRYDEAAGQAGPPVFKRGSTRNDGGRNMQASQAQDPGMSYVLLSESQAGPPAAAPEQGQDGAPSKRRGRKGSLGFSDEGSLADRMETNMRLFEILSSRSDIDHPICAECTGMLMEGMEKRLANARKERDAFAEYLTRANADLPTEEEARQTEEEIKQVQAEEEEAFAKLEQLEAEKASLEDELADFEDEARELDREEESFFKERNAFELELRQYEEERDSLNLRLEHDSRQLELLQKTNVYNDTFNISHDKDDFGTINGLRLARQSSKPVEWAEINAAWGQALLLMVVVAERLDFGFKDYKLCPVGSTSNIEQSKEEAGKKKTITHSLYYTGENPISWTWLRGSFDAAMVAFLRCLKQLGQHIEKRTANTDAPKKMPYTMSEHKINDLSIKLSSFYGDESWSKACKFTLICCKWCLAYASSVDTTRSQPP